MGVVTNVTSVISKRVFSPGNLVWRSFLCFHPKLELIVSSHQDIISISIIIIHTHNIIDAILYKKYRY